MEELLKYIVAEWQAIQSAPGIFLTGAVLVAVAVFVVMTWFYRGRLETADARIKLKDELADYKSKLGGASPDEAKALIAKLQASS